MKKTIWGLGWGVGFFIVLSAFAGTLIGNGRWSDGESNISWKVSDSWRGSSNGRKVLLSNRHAIKNALFETRVVFEIASLAEGEELESWIKKKLFNGSYAPYSAGVLNGFRSEFLEPAGDPSHPRMVSRFFFPNPCRQGQVFDLAVESLTSELADPRELLQGINCFEPIRD